MKAIGIYVAKFIFFALPVIIGLIIVFWPVSRMRAILNRSDALNGVEIPLGLIIFIKFIGLVIAGVFGYICVTSLILEKLN